MAYTGQTEVDELRLVLQETDALNSRWTDPQLLAYVNRGRRKYSEESQAVKALFEQTLAAGPTVLGGDRYARYPLEPTTLEIDAVRYDGLPLEEAGEESWDANVSGMDVSTRGTPFMWIRRGGVLDIFFTPSSAGKILEYLASVIPVDLTLALAENELSDVQVRVALDYAAAEALTDDGRDGSIYSGRADVQARKHKRRLARPGPKFVKVGQGG
jgi:hypothetical protein